MSLMRDKTQDQCAMIRCRNRINRSQIDTREKTKTLQSHKRFGRFQRWKEKRMNVKQQ